MDGVIQVLYSILTTTGIILNCLLLYVIAKKTPKEMNSFSIILLNFAITDLFTCILSGFVQQRITHVGDNLAFLSSGPCGIFGPCACFVGYSAMLSLYSHSLWSMLASFSYRYYILHRPQPSKRRVLMVIALISIPSWIQFVTFSLALSDQESMESMILKKFPEFQGKTVYGLINIYRWQVMLCILHMTIPVTPVYLTIILLRRVILDHLAARDMSMRMKYMHNQLLKALTYHALVPAFFVVGVASYLIGQLNIYHHPVLQYATFLVGSCIPIISPIVSLYFVRPYSRWIRRLMGLSEQKLSLVEATNDSKPVNV